MGDLTQLITKASEPLPHVMWMLCLLGVIALYKNTITSIDLFNLLIQLSDPLSGGSPIAKQKAEFGVRLNQP